MKNMNNFPRALVFFVCYSLDFYSCLGGYNVLGTFARVKQNQQGWMNIDFVNKGGLRAAQKHELA